VSALAFVAGSLRSEPILLLVGAVFAVCLVYCLLAVSLLALVHRRRAALLDVRIVPDKLPVNGRAALILSRKARFFQLPAVLVRYRLRLWTRDGRRIERVFDGSLFTTGASDFAVGLRGAYRGTSDELVIADIAGFFRASVRLPRSEGARLLVMPVPAALPQRPLASAGGADGRGEAPAVKTDDLHDQRPYIPGDDPRRINWKLYSHAGELFVRQEALEPPPRSLFALLLDTSADAALYSEEAGAKAVDALCSAALSMLLEKAASGQTVLFGFTGSGTRGGSEAELPALLAYPARTPLDSSPALPAPSAFPVAGGILVMALPRADTAKACGLHGFLRSLPPGQSLRILFCYTGERLKPYAEASAAAFNRMRGVRAIAVRIGGGHCESRRRD
jgi:uncharacterized protein (DUF58 family)